MADHVAVGVVQDDHVVLVLVDAGQHSLRDLVGAHFGLDVEGGNLLGGRGGHQDAILAREDALLAAVEEEGDVGVLLGLGNAQLGLAALGEVLAHGHGQALRRIGDGHVGHRRVVLRHADVVQREEAVLALKAGEIRIHEGAGDLTGAVGAEVEEHHGVVGLDRAVCIQHGGQHKLVGQVLAGLIDHFIGIADGLHGVVCRNALGADHGVVGLLHALPGEVAVHGVQAAHGGGDLAHADFLHLILELLHILPAGIRGNVAAVEQRVHVHLLDAVALCHLQQAVEVLGVGMHATGGDQADQMQGGVVRLAVLHRAQQRLVFKEHAVLNVLGDLHQHLIDHAARANVGVSHLGVAHLAVRQTNVQTGCADGGHGILCLQRVDVRRALGEDGVGLGIGRTDPKSVKNQKCSGRHQ